jgi:hypothetical protein
MSQRGVVPVHEDIRARLNLGKDAREGIESRSAGASARDRLAPKAVNLDRLECSVDPLSHLRNHGLPLSDCRTFLCMACVGLQSFETKTGRIRYEACELGGLPPWLDAAPFITRIDLNEYVQARLRCSCGRLEQRHGCRVIDRDPHPRPPRQQSKAVRLSASDDLIRDIYVSDSGLHKRFRFCHFLAADTNRAQRELPMRYVGRFVALRVRSQCHTVLSRD